MTLFRRIELGRQNLCDVVTQTQIQGQIISSDNHDAIMTAYALLPKELKKGIPEYKPSKKKKKVKNIDTSKEEGSVEGDSLPLESTERGEASTNPRFVDESLSPIAELMRISVDVTRHQSRLKNNASELTNDAAFSSQSKNPKKILQVGPKGLDNFTTGALSMNPSAMKVKSDRDDNGDEVITDETVKISKEELEDLRKSNYFLINNGNVEQSGPIMKNIEPKVEEVKETKKTKKVADAEAAAAQVKKSPPR